LGSERYVLTYDNQSFREVASFVPYDFVVILANDQKYGGGGIFNLYATVVVGSRWAPYVFVHELGHHMAGLADEYFTSPVAYEEAAEVTEPWEPNVTVLRNPEQLKWKDLLSPGVPIPTPWDREAWTQWQREVQRQRREIRTEGKPEQDMEELFDQEKKQATSFLSSQKHATQVGAFEGANYRVSGYYRPQIDCIMFSRNDVPFCAVCRRALETIIDLYTRVD
jgi:hypothetical protein